MQTALGEPASLIGQLAQLLANVDNVVTRGAVTQVLAIRTDDLARPPLAHPVT